MAGDGNEISANGLGNKSYELEKGPDATSGLNLNIEASDVKDVTQPAGFWIRFAAFWIDEFLFGMITMIVFTVSFAVAGVSSAGINSMQGGDPNEQAMKMMMIMLPAMGLAFLVMMVARFFYFGWFHKNKGAGPGKLMLGLKVLDAETGTHIGYWRTFGRDMVGKQFISSIILYIGFIMVAFNDEKKALHDMVFATNVVKKQ